MTQPVTDAAEVWRARQADADTARAAVIAAVVDARAAGVSEYRLAQAAGVTRQTVRVWLGKGDGRG